MIVISSACGQAIVPRKRQVSITTAAKSTRVNEMIRVREVRVIDEEGQQLGILPTYEAIRLAQEHGVDLVEVAPNAVPPVCRLLDFGKFQYERQKKEREARRAQKVIEVKEIRLRPRTGEHDLDTKVRQSLTFLEEGAKVRVAVRFRGREITHPEIAREQLAEFAEKVGEAAIIEQPPAMEGPNLFMMLSPGKK
ncbi:MAG: translation initiation factor [Chloroflexota bacterium]|nr:translation initiation factor [Chloroflexota bacterium]